MVEKEKTTKKKTAAKKAPAPKMSRPKPSLAVADRPKKEKIEAVNPEVLPVIEPMLADSAELKGAPRYFYAIGRRKRASAIVRLFTRGSGEITINKSPWEKYFPTKQLTQVVEAPLIEAGQRNNVNVEVTVEGGGKQGQAGAVSLGISRALLKLNPVFRRALRRHGFLTRDSREKERKKYGLKKARRAPQFAKR